MAATGSNGSNTAHAASVRSPRPITGTNRTPSPQIPVPKQALAGLAPLVLAGAGATPQAADAVRARLLTQDPVTAAEQVGWPR
jgi:hypothetical protein